LELFGAVGLAAQATPPIPTHFFVAWSVCRMCVTFVPCLNHSMVLQLLATWPVHLWGPVTHCFRWGPWPQGNWSFGVEPPMQLQTAAKPSVLCCHMANTSEELGGVTSDFAFCQITLVLVICYRHL